ncbi:MAG: helix-turn-helix domain-containing protein, partial [Opitutaceae bacterium]
WSKPEFAAVHRLLGRAARGLHFKGSAATEAAQRLATLPGLTGLPAILALWSVLGALATARGTRPLASAAYAPPLDKLAEARMARVHAFLESRHAEPLTLPQLARIAAMTPPAFSRYFKRLMGRNVSDYINDLRVDHATRLLRETSRSIADIAGEAGYATLSNFNRRFHERHGRSPREYRGESEPAKEM